jgi:hypothetical protein
MIVAKTSCRIQFRQMQSNSVVSVMKGNEYFVSLQMSVVLTGEYYVVVNIEELIGTTEYLAQYYEMSYKPMSL